MWKSSFDRPLLVLALMLCSASPAFAEYFVIKDYGVQVRFEADGAMQFRETIEVEFFAERHGIFRSIPLVNIISEKRKKLIVRDVSVESWPFSTSHENNNLVLKIGDPDRYVNGRQVYVIQYRVINGLNFFDTHAEFYWDLLGISWEVPVEQFHFEIQFPAVVELSESDLRLFTGAAGSTGSEAAFNLLRGSGGPHITGRTSRVFTPGEAVTLAVRLPKNAFPQPSSWRLWFHLHGLLLVPGALLSAVLGLLFYSRNRRQAIMVELQPPLDISPAVAGGFIDHRVENHDVLSLVPLLASRGYLKLEVTEETALWVFKNREIRFTKLKEAGAELQPFERHFLEALFSSGKEVDLDSLKNRFYQHMNDIRSEVRGWIDAQKWYEPGQRTNQLLTLGAAALSLGTGIWALTRDNPDGFWLLGVAALLFILSWFFNQRNEAGNMIYKKLEGFRRFIVKAERPVLERLLQEDPHYFDKTLPYAVAFGEVKRWTQNFDGLLSQPPSWYYAHQQGSGLQRFSMDSFAAQFSEEINNINSVFGSSPSSSGSGGGSSGGGSGGGGGGSW